MPQQQNKLASVRGETTVPRHHNEPLVTSHKNHDSENHHSEFFIQSEKNGKKWNYFYTKWDCIFFVIFLTLYKKFNTLYLFTVFATGND